MVPAPFNSTESCFSHASGRFRHRRKISSVSSAPVR